MQSDISYVNILRLSIPIMLGGAAQNIIALSDSIFLYYYSEIYKMGNGEFGTIGFIGVFYLIIAAIGYGFSRGGQILIARKVGERNSAAIGRTFYSLMAFELVMAIVMFVFMMWGCPYFFKWFVKSPIVYEQSLEYLKYRSFGVFFSYAGVAIIALYSGISRAAFIIVDTLILGIINLIFNYALVFGKWGFPQMGIGGAALASSLAEAIAFVIFIIYMLFDRQIRRYRIFRIPSIDLTLIRHLLKLSTPMLIQSLVGVGSWFFFFTLIENMGDDKLEISNLARMIYLTLSIPIWGFCSGINTMASNCVGSGNHHLIFPLTFRTSLLSFATTMLLTLPVILYPEDTLYFLLDENDRTLFIQGQKTFEIVGGILAIFAVSSIALNALSGVGETMKGLSVQLLSNFFYIALVYIIVKHLYWGLEWAWGVEILYWLIIWIVSIWYLKKYIKSVSFSENT